MLKVPVHKSRLGAGWYWGLFSLVVLLAVVLRAPELGFRVMHNDEGVNAIKFDELWHGGAFKYDPNEYHGPTLYYLTLPVVWLRGAKDFAATTEVTYRLVPLIFGVGLILLLPLVSDGIGRGGVLWAGLLTAVSPAFVYYSRYYIHEVPLVFFAFASIACGWRYRRSGRLTWAVLAGAFLGLAYATKETWVIALAAAAGSGVAAATIWRFLLKRSHHALHFRLKAVGVAGAAFVVVFVVMFSGFFADWRGPLKAIEAYVHYTGRASGSVHDHPWFYYLQLLAWVRTPKGPVWTEAAILALAVVGFFRAVMRRHPSRTASAIEEGAALPAGAFAAYPPFVRFVAFYTLFLTLAYSLIPYKTPWCVLGFFHGMILLAGFASGELIKVAPRWYGKGAVGLVLLAAAGQLAWQADRATNNYLARKPTLRHYWEADARNPWVYAHTGATFRALVRRIDEVMPFTPNDDWSQINVIGTDYWPLPFYLRRYHNVGYPADLSDAGDVPVMVSPMDLDGPLQQKLKGDYVAEIHRLRPGVFLVLRVERSVWDKFLATRTGK
jgi:uncharacterized protein (TIGR03663 family)